MPADIPLIDLSKCGLLIEENSSVREETFAKIGKELYFALSTSGFAYLANHGIKRSQVDGVNEIAEKFYALPDEEKRKLYAHRINFAYDPLGTTRAKGYADAQEGFRISGKSFFDENTPWPNVPMMKERCIGMAENCKKLQFRLLKALGIGMKLKDPDYFCKAHSLMNHKGNGTMFKLNHFIPISSDDTLPESKMRLGEHTDWTTLVFLFQDNNGGLQIMTPSGEFKDVDPIPDTIVLNIGDTLMSWSGGRLKATVHRVAPPPNPENHNKIRRSIVYFGQANDDVLMESLEYEDGIPNEDEAAENPLRISEYMAIKFDKHFH